MKKHNNPFNSNDFYLSAYLLANDCELVEIEFNDSKRATFLFESVNEELINNFWLGRGQIEPKRFISSIKELKQRLYSIN